MGIELHDNSRMHITWVQPDSLAVELYQPRTMKDGHGLILQGTPTWKATPCSSS